MQVDPTSLTPTDVLQLQRTIGNRATGRLLAQQLSVQTKLQLGPANDKYEQEADDVARQVVRRMSAPPVQRADELDEEVQAKPRYDTSAYTTTPTSQPVSVKRTFVAPKVQREEVGEDLTQASPLHGLEGGDVEASVAQTIQRAKGSGSRLDPRTRSGMEGTFGANFGGVRIHTGRQADTLNRSLNARAFTTGNDIFFRSGEYNPDSSGGKELLAHELTHTVQQGASLAQPDSTHDTPDISRMSAEGVQRDIGFEFETNTVMTYKTNRRQALPNGGFPNPGAAQAVLNDPRTTRVDKGKALLRRNDIEIQADDRPNGSDLEAVTTHFPLTGPGRAQLSIAVAAMANLVNAYTHVAAPAGNVAPAVALNGTAGFTTGLRDGVINGNWGTATTAPQVTVGTRIGNIGDIVRDLHGDPHETPMDKATRDPGRLRFRRPNNLNPLEPRALNALDDMSTLVNGHTLARMAIGLYQHTDPLAPAGNELEGLLTIIFTYCEGMQHKQAFLKQHTPLMAKTNLATIFTTLPGPVQTYYSTKDHAGVSNLEKLVAEAPGYDVLMGQPLFTGVSGVAEDDQPLGQPQWYHRLTLESWLRGIVLRDRTRGEAAAQWIKDNWGGSTMRPGKDQLTTKHFPGRPRGQEIEGYGALGGRMDVDPTTGNALPVFELRAASRPYTFAAAGQWALELFDYFKSLNENPGGGYTHIA
ncbi:MAG: DUF4157 domain-containing protein [Caldilineaceae bacterium]